MKGCRIGKSVCVNLDDVIGIDNDGNRIRVFFRGHAEPFALVFDTKEEAERAYDEATARMVGS